MSNYQAALPQQTGDIDPDIVDTQAAIKAAEAENALYSGGLVKGLVALRLVTLRQTEAMLQQASKARHAGIALTYTTDGKQFLLTEGAKNELAVVEQELQSLRTKITAQQATVNRLSGGLVLAMGLSNIATMRQTEAMLDQRRLALKHSLPQFIAFANANSCTGSAPSSNPMPARALPTQSQERNWQIIGVDSRVTETNETWWRYAWKLILKNNADVPQRFSAEIELQDADGFVIHSNMASSLVIPAHSQQVFTGYQLVRMPGASKVAKTNAKVRQG
jgi:hypothetical protein